MTFDSYYILPWFQVVFCLVLIPIVIRGHLRSVTNNLFAAYLLGLATWGLLIFLMRSSPSLEDAHYWEKWVMGLALLLSVIFFHFSIVYTHSHSYQWPAWAGYGLWATVMSLSRTNLIVQGMQLRSYGYAPVGGPLFLPLSIICFAFMILALINLVKFNSRTLSTEEKNRTIYIIIGVIISLASTPFDLLPMLGLPLYPGIIIGNILFCIIVTIAIAKHNLLDIRLVIRKGTAYILMSTIVAVPYVLIIVLLNKIFENVALWLYIVLIIVLAILLQPIWSAIQRIVNRVYYRERYTYLQSLNDFSRQTHDTTDLNLLSKSLVGLVGKALQTSSALLMLRGEPDDFDLIASTIENDSSLTFKNHSPVVNWMKSHSGLVEFRDFDNIPQLQAMTTEENNALIDRKIELLVTLKTKKNELFGLLLLGKKLSQQIYSEEDKQLVLSVTSLVAIELENARLYNIEKLMRQELQKQNEQRTEFLHSVAHDLKTPLTAILSSSELLASNSTAPETIRTQLIDNIFHGALIMDRRVSELLDLAKMHIGELQIKAEPLDICRTVNEIGLQLRVLFDNKMQMFTMEIPERLPAVKADRVKVEQVIYNLLSNANKFSPYNSEVVLRMRSRDRRIVIEVEDSAAIIPDEEKEKVFSPYYRSADAEKKDRFPGLGLGLAISKRIVELHNGQISISSSIRRGNIFSVSLPVLEDTGTFFRQA